jgi:ABC-2 type transport system permease protein
MIVLQVATRLTAFVGKELVEIVRRPGAIVSLILGPFLIMAIFGLGYNGYRRPLQTIIVVPPQAGLPTDLKVYQDVAVGLEILNVTTDASEPLKQLRDRVVDTVIVAPNDLEQRFLAGQQSVLEVHINDIDPIQQAYAGFLASRLASEINARIIERVAGEGQQYAVNAGQPDAARIPPKVIAAPTRAEVTNEAPLQPAVINFYGPAVLALILQHLAVTLIALSLVRERTSGIMELFRISPISTWEVIVGKLLAFGVLSGLLSSVTLFLMVTVLHVPILGDPLLLALVLALLTIASLALGMFIALISDSERQAVQLSLLLLLASVFFSGFVLRIEEFNAPVRTAAYLLPVTHGIRLAQDVMLRGSTNEGWEIVALAVIAAVLLIATWFLLRRGMTRI